MKDKKHSSFNKDKYSSKSEHKNFSSKKDFMEKQDFENIKDIPKVDNKGFNKKKSFNKKNKKNEKENYENIKLKNFEEELEQLKARIAQETPPCGYYYFNKEDFNFSSDSESDNENYNNNNNNKDEKENKDADNENKELDEAPKIKYLWKKEKFYFKDLPLSRKTLKGLAESKFIKMTPVQRYTLAHSLAGRDILGASKTGSGKTLCFILPVIEALYRQKWTSLDGLGALIILPTRELAIQVFEVVRLAGKYHDFSLGLVIGGNDLQNEKDSLYKINILIGTPGRLSQHFSETPYFTTENLQMLVIDEADRILDDGFENDLNNILSYLPTKTRQTLLFSATLTKSLKRLAKISLKTPEYINVNNTDAFLSLEKVEDASNTNNTSNLKQEQINLKLSSDNNNNENLNNKEANDDNQQLNTANNNNVNNTNNDLTPINLNQFYTICETHDKMDILFSFLKTHKNAKCLVFLSSCKQVRYYTEVFKRLKLGMTFLDLHGKQKQTKRTNIFYTFLNKKNTVLFATDVAARGVDFPAVDWVIQLDCPEDLSTYVHRVGRTARYKSRGNSLLFVNQKEEKIVDYLQNKNVKIKRIKINISKVVRLQPILRSLISENNELIHLAQKAIKSYLKSVYLQSNKEIFDLNSIDVQQLALSYGLVNLPEIKISRKSENEMKNLKKSLVNNQDEENDDYYTNSEDHDDDAKKDNKKKKQITKA